MSTDTSRAQTRVYINWDEFEKAIKKSKKTKAEICRDIVRGESYFSQQKRNGNSLPENMVTLLCRLYGWDFDTLTREPGEVKKENELQILTRRVTAIEEQIKQILESTKKNGTPDEELLTKPEKAVILLKQMTFGNGSCEQTDFISKAAQMGLSQKMCEHAIKFTQSKIITKGYGQNKTRWIVRE